MMSTTTQQILLDEHLDKQLLQQGYVVIPFLTADEVAALTNFYYEHRPRQQDGMYATAHAPDLDFRMKMNNFIKEVFARAIQKTFTGYNALGGSFIAKGKGTAGTLQPHQDWNIVDEEQFRSFNIWVPLVDLHENNGVIKILPNSHAWLKTYRSANIDSAYSQVNDLLWEQMVSLFMKKGEALVYDHRLLHASGENTADEIRLAAVYGIIPEKSSMRYYHKADDKTVEVFKSNPEFFLYGNIFEGPKGLESINKLDYGFPAVTPEQFQRLLNHDSQPLQINRISMFKKIKAMLGV